MDTPTKTDAWVSEEAKERGQRIRFLREAKGWSMEYLASLIGVQRAAIHKWENGMVENIGGINLVNLSEALGTSTGYVLWGKDQRPAPSGSTSPTAPIGATGRFRGIRNR